MSDEGESAGASGSSLAGAAQRIRDAAKYLIATFGAVGAVLVSGLSLTALPSGRHPIWAAVAVFVAVLALVGAIALAIRVMVPEQMTLSQLVSLSENHPDDELAKFLRNSEELFGGMGTNLGEFHKSYLDALTQRVEAYQAYLDRPTTKTRQTASEVASARAELLNVVAGQLLDVAVFFQLKRRFSAAFPMISAAALVVVLAAAAYAWASSKPADAPKQPQRPKPVNCVTYYLELDRLADDDTPGRHPATLFPIDPQAKTCGFRSEVQLTRFVTYLSGR